MRDLLESLGLRAGSLARGMSLKVTLRLARRELDARDIRLILADGIDAAYDLEALLGLLALVDAARQEGRPLGLLCAGERDLARWLAGSAAALSRTLRQERFSPLSLGETLGVLRDWLPAFETLAAGTERGEKDALRVARAIQDRTSGALRRLEMFARLWLLQPSGAAAKPEAKRVDTILAKLHTEGQER